MNFYILWIMILEGCYQGLHWGLKLLQVLWIKIQDQEDASSSTTIKPHSKFILPITLVIIACLCDMWRKFNASSATTSTLCNMPRPLYALLVDNVVLIFYLNNFESKYSKFSPLGSLVDFVVNKFPKFATLLPTHGDHVSPLKAKKKWMSYEST